MPEEQIIETQDKDSRFLKKCPQCGKEVYDPKALVSDRVVFCSVVCERNYIYEKRKVG